MVTLRQRSKLGIRINRTRTELMSRHNLAKIDRHPEPCWVGSRPELLKIKLLERPKKKRKVTW